MPPIIVDLLQDSDDDEFYVAQFRPSKRSPPPPQQAPPLKKQSLRTPIPIRNAHPTSSSSSPIISLVSPSKRKIQQPITSFFSSPKIKSERVAVQKPITSFFSPPRTKSKKMPARAPWAPVPPPIHFSREHVRVSDDEAPTPAEFQVFEFHPSQPSPEDIYPKSISDGLTPATPLLVTSSPPSSPTAAATSPTIMRGPGEKRRAKRAEAAAAATTVVPSPRIIKAMPKKRSESAAFGSSSRTEDKGRSDIKSPGKPPKKVNMGDIRMRYRAVGNEGSSSGTVDHSGQTASAEGRSGAARAPSIQLMHETIVHDHTVDKLVPSGPPVNQWKTSHRGYPIDSRSDRFTPSPQKAQNPNFNVIPEAIDISSPPSQEVDFGYNPPSFDVKQITCTNHEDPECDDLDCISDFFEEYSPYHDTVGEADPVQADSQPIKITKPPPAPEPTPKIEDTIRLRHEYLGLLLATGTLDAKYRRPYLSCNARDFLRDARTQPGMWEELMKEHDGELIHAQFTIREILVLACALLDYVSNKSIIYPAADPNEDTYVDIHRLTAAVFEEHKDDGEMIEHLLQEYLYFPMDKLPGREKEDCVKFLLDCFYRIPDASDPSILVDLSARPLRTSTHVARTIRDLGLRLPSRLGAVSVVESRANVAFNNLKPLWNFSEGSSDIHDIVWSSDGTRFGMATTCYNDMYNRPGNLMLGVAEPYHVKMLYRHAFRVRQQTLGNLERFMYATVSSIHFSNDSKLLYSAGYDGLVKVWRAKDGQWLSDIPLKHKIMLMNSSPITNHLIATGCSDGSINVLRLDAEGALAAKPYVCHINKSEEVRKMLHPSCLAWGNEHVPNWLFAGYDTDIEGGNHGGLVIFDVERKVNLFKAPRGGIAYPTRHFDIAMHSEGVSFVTSSANEKGGGSVVRLFDIRDMAVDPVCFKSKQKDVNKVTISPCQNYITSSGTNGSTLVWDTRSPDAPLVELEHDKTLLPITENTDLEAEDTGVTFAQWGRYSDRFFTGSSDGVVKMWDISLGKPFLKNIAKVPTQIMSAAFSPSWDELIVGECSGAATLFSTRADEDVPPAKVAVDWTEDEGKTSPDNEDMPLSTYEGGGRAPLMQVQEPEAETGARFARELVDEGMMWIDGRWAWATEEYTKKMDMERNKH